MIAYILIIALSTSQFHGSQSAGSAAITQEFNSEKTCLDAGKAIVKQAAQRGNFTLTWGCFKK